VTLSLDAELVHSAIKGGFDPKRLPARYDRCVGELTRAGLLDVTDTGRDAASVTLGVTRDVTSPLTPAERARRARAKRKAEQAARDAARDGVTANVTEERDSSRDASRVLSLSSPLDSGSLPDSSPLSEALGDQVVGAREAESVTPTVTDPTDLAARDRRDAELGKVLRIVYARRWERDWGEPCPSRPSADEELAVVRWASAQPDPLAAIERFVDGAFSAAKWRKRTCRSPWRFISEDPGATAAYSTAPSASPAQANRPPLPRQELPLEPAEAGGAF
jgi:hypothetical protein